MSLIPILVFITGIARASLRAPASGPLLFLMDVNSSIGSESNLQNVQYVLAVITFSEFSPQDKAHHTGVGTQQPEMKDYAGLQ